MSTDDRPWPGRGSTSHGPMSNEVYDAHEAVSPDLVATELGLEMTWPGPLPRLPSPLAEAAAEYGGWRPWSGT